ncbi:MFS transporter [Streptomyces werraensis]
MFMSFIEVTAAISTLRAMQVDLGVAPADLSWVSSTYTLVVAAGVLSGGAFGERYGRRRVFLLGVAALAAGSLAVAVSDGFAQVLAGRALSGVGGALVLPTSLALITTSFTDPRERGHRISVWVSVSGLGLAGPRAAHAGQAGPQAATASSPRISRPTGLLRTAVRFFPPPCGQGLLEHPWWNTAQGGYTDACLGVEVDLAVRVQHAGEVLLAADVR